MTIRRLITILFLVAVLSVPACRQDKGVIDHHRQAIEEEEAYSGSNTDASAHEHKQL